jgi:hypothetical protein
MTGQPGDPCQPFQPYQSSQPAATLSVADRDVQAAATAIRQGNVKAPAASSGIDKCNDSQS